MGGMEPPPSVCKTVALPLSYTGIDGRLASGEEGWPVSVIAQMQWSGGRYVLVE
jgi:hypothetical protein